MSSASPTLPSGETLSTESLRLYLRDYYGKVLGHTDDLEKNACCADETRKRHAAIVRLIPEEVRSRNYGCGCSIPRDDLTGLSVLDLGSGAGFDAFIVAKLVGPEGRVIGIDMTDEQLDVARRNVDPVMRAYGYSRPNVEFHQGYIESAEAVDNEAVDLVISDCVINLSPLKNSVLETVFRVLRPGGEMYISDIVADRRVPAVIAEDPKLVAECLGGALYEHDFLDLVRDAGFGDPRVVSRSLVEEGVNGHPTRFLSVTVRAFKLESIWDRRCEDYGQVAFYRGNCAEQPAMFLLDDHHLFEAGRPLPVCRNTARMLTETRLARYFEVTPAREHLGLFDCGGSTGPEHEPGPCC